MEQKKAVIKPYKAVCILLAVLMALLIGSALACGRKGENYNPVFIVNRWTLQSGSDKTLVTLPLFLPTSQPRSTVTLSTEITPREGDHLYIKTVYAPLRVYIDGALVYEYGQDRLYPGFLSDPPTDVELVPIMRTGNPVSIKLEFQSPHSRNVLALHPVLLGTSGAILGQLFSQMGFSLFFSVVLLALGVILLLVAMLIIRLHKTGFCFFWLGLFSISVGAWVLGECNLTAIFIHNPPLLYLLAFIGLFTFSLPLLRFVLLIMDLNNRKPLELMCRFLDVSVLCALLLQFTGAVQFSASMYLFHVLQPLALCLLGGCIFIEAVRYHNPKSRRFALPILIVALFTMLEVANYYVLHFTSQMSLFFQIGVVIFLCMVIFICSGFIRDAIAVQSEKHRLKYENHLMECQIEIQKERYDTLTKIDADIRAQRHDLRHQLIVLRRFAENNDTDKLIEYLDTLTVNIPVPLRRYCENEAVNAVTAYYAALMEKAGIASCDISLEIPQQTGNVPENDLCIIIGNLMENALEACHNVQDGSAFIQIKSRLHYGTLSITMDNSLESVIRASDGCFLSWKPGGGTGLHSICTIAEKYSGKAEFEAHENRFSSSVYLRLE